MDGKLFTKDFTLVIIGQIISLFGNAILRFALPLYLLRETRSPMLFGLVTACSFLPVIVLSFIGGVLADRVNKRNIMVVLDFLTAGIVLVVTLALGHVPLVPLVIVSLMLLYGISGAYQPAVQASIPALVDKAHLLQGGAVINQISALAGLLGPIVGGMLFGVWGIVPILWISMLCFVASAIMEIFITIPYEKRETTMGVAQIIKSDWKDSMHYMKKEKPMLLKIVLMVTLFNLVLTSMMVVGIPILIVDTLQMSDTSLGFAQGALAFGGLTGGILTGVFSKRLSLRNSHILLACCALFIGGMALPLWLGATNGVCYLTIVGTSFSIMALATMFSVQLIATVQLETPPVLVGKVIALMMSLSLCAQPVGQAVYGLVFDVFSEDLGMVLFVVAVISGGIALASKALFVEDKEKLTGNT